MARKSRKLNNQEKRNKNAIILVIVLALCSAVSNINIHRKRAKRRAEGKIDAQKFQEMNKDLEQMMVNGENFNPNPDNTNSKDADTTSPSNLSLEESIELEILASLAKGDVNFVKRPKLVGAINSGLLSGAISLLKNNGSLGKINLQLDTSQFEAQTVEELFKNTKKAQLTRLEAELVPETNDEGELEIKKSKNGVETIAFKGKGKAYLIKGSKRKRVILDSIARIKYDPKKDISVGIVLLTNAEGQKIEVPKSDGAKIEEDEKGMINVSIKQSFKAKKWEDLKSKSRRAKKNSS